MFTRTALLVATLSGLVLSTNALASGGSYAFEGGTPKQRATVSAALDASAFPWDIVPKQIKIRIGKGYDSEASRGTISLDSDLLDAGVFSWGTVQHEYAHQVDYFLFDDATRARLFPILGGRCWFATCGALHGELTSERFASTLAWSYWPRYSNTMKPEGPGDESAAMKPGAFRSLMAQVLGVPAALPAPAQAADHEWMKSRAKAKARAKHKKKNG
jgi:hypothetical protein